MFRTRALTVPLSLTLAASAACTAAERPPQPALRGTELAEPLPRPAFTLTATDGTPFEFRARTRGTVTLLFFGYTNCPDVCPVHAANIAAVLRTLSWEDRQRIKFVFVTTDPNRDSLPAIRAWLAHFDSSFIGLRGPVDEVNRIQASLQLPGAIRGEARADGAYEVGHSAVVIAFAPDDSARVIYPFGTRQEDWAADLPKLLLNDKPATVRVHDAYYVPGAGFAPGALYATFTNEGTAADTVTGIESPISATIELHHTMTDAAGRTMMHSGATLAVPARGRASLAPGALHGMVSAARGTYAEGDTVALTFTLAHHRPITAPAIVLDFARVDSVLRARGR